MNSANVSHSDWCLQATMIGALRQFLASAPFDLDVADHPQQPQRAARIAPQNAEHEACGSKSVGSATIMRTMMLT